MLRWCERHGVNYVVGLARNERVVQVCRHYLDRAARSYARSQVKPRLFGEVRYGAQSWDKPRRVIVKAEHTGKGSNPRFVVTNLTAAAQGIYDGIYCARGEMENRIKEQQLGLFAERTRCHGWWANQFRLLLSGCAYALMERLRAVGLKGTELARAQVGTIRLKLLKVGAVVLRNTRRVRFLISSAYPHRSIFMQVVGAFNSA